MAHRQACMLNVVLGWLSRLQVLFDFSPPDFSFERGCPFHSYRFSAGQCLMTTAYASHFKVGSTTLQQATCARQCLHLPSDMTDAINQSCQSIMSMYIS